MDIVARAGEKRLVRSPNDGTSINERRTPGGKLSGGGLRVPPPPAPPLFL
jgi:hypothetical protein